MRQFFLWFNEHIESKSPCSNPFEGVIVCQSARSLSAVCEVEGIVSDGFAVRALIVVRRHPLRANRRDSPFFELQ